MSRKSLSDGKPAPPKNVSTPAWVYTLNNYTEGDISKLQLLDTSLHRCCKEVAESGTPHLQGAIVFRRGYRLPQLKKLFPNIHWEPSKTKDAHNYCIKGEIAINVDNRKQGVRTDLEDLYQMVKSKAPSEEILDSFPGAFFKYTRGIGEAQRILMPKITSYTPSTVIVLTGISGSGKSRLARMIDPNLYNVSQPTKDGPLWFDGYQANETLLFDDYYGGWCSESQMLKILDAYPMSVPIKGGFVPRNWKRIIITSEHTPHRWSHRGATEGMFRRITFTLNFDTILDIDMLYTLCHFLTSDHTVEELDLLRHNELHFHDGDLFEDVLQERLSNARQCRSLGQCLN